MDAVVTSLDLSGCLTNTVGEKEAFLRMKTVSGQRGLMKAVTKAHACFSSSLLHSWSSREWKNKYLHWAVRHCWNICGVDWYEIFSLFLQGISTWRAGNGTNILLDCIIAVLLVSALWKHLIPAVPLRHWGGAWLCGHTCPHIRSGTLW